MKLNRSTRGFSLVEMLIYIAILVLLLLMIINVVTTLAKANRRTTASRQIEQAVGTSFERMIREIRGADSIDTTNSTFDSNPGRLVLTTSSNGRSSQSEDFYLQGGVLKLNEAGSYAGPLTSSSTNITSLIFRKIVSTSTAIRIEMQISAGTGTTLVSKTFYDTAIIRSSY